MIRQLENAPAGVLALSLSGTVIESDLVNSVNDWVDQTGPEEPACIALRIEEDFDGYDREIINALLSGDLKCRFRRIAVMADDNFSPLTEDRLEHVAPDGVRMFARGADAAAYRWLAAT